MDDIIQMAMTEPWLLSAAQAELAIAWFESRLHFLRAVAAGALPDAATPEPCVDLVAPKTPSPLLRTPVITTPAAPTGVLGC